MEGAPQVNPYEAGHFELHGGGLDVIYDQVPGQPALRHMTVVSEGKAPKRFRGGQVKLNETAIGRMATVVTDFVPDGDTHELSVLLPAVNLGDASSANVSTVAIRTDNKGSFAGPAWIAGALASYEPIGLSGSASRGKP